MTIPLARHRLHALLIALALLTSAAVFAPVADARPCADCTDPDGGGGGGGGGTINTPPRASFTVSPSGPMQGQLVTFSSTSTDDEGNIARYEWDFDGDGQTDVAGTDASASYRYAAPGNYNARLRVVDTRGAGGEATQAVAVSATSGGTGGGGGGGEGGGSTVVVVPPPEPSPDPGCVSEATVGEAQLVGECLRQDGSKIETTGSVRVSGLDLKPVGGSLLFDTSTLTLTGQASIKLGNIELCSSCKLDWKLAEALDLDAPASAALASFPIKGKVKVDLTADGKVTADLNVEVKGLGSAFGNVTGQTKLVADNKNGLQIGSLEVKVGEALLGPIQVKDTLLKYEQKTDMWLGKASVLLPTGQPPLRVDAEASFIGGSFAGAGAAVDNLNVPIAPGVNLQRIAFAIEVKPKLKLEGGIAVSAGAPVPVGGATVQPVRIDGRLKILFGDPTTVRADGALSVMNRELAKGYFEYRTNGYVGFGGSGGFFLDPEKKIGFEGSVNGWIDGVAFNVDGQVKITVYDWKLQGDVVVSNVGLAACAKTKIAFWTVELGAGYRWADNELNIMAAACDLGPYKAKPSARAAGTDGGRTLALPEGLPVSVFRITGHGGAPKVKISGPKGQEAVSPDKVGESEVDRFLFVNSPQDKTTYVAVARPAEGDWSIAPQEGSAPIASVEQASGLPDPRVKGRIRRTRAGRELTYDVRPIAGQVVKFVEQSPDGGSQVIGKARGRKGTLRFKPAPGSGARAVVAVVEQGGLVREQIPVGRYAVKEARIAKVKRLALRRKGDKLTVSWAPSSGAKRYAVYTMVGDGQRTMRIVTGRSATIEGVPATEPATVTVGGLSAGGKPGARAKVKIRARARSSR